MHFGSTKSVRFPIAVNHQSHRATHSRPIQFRGLIMERRTRSRKRERRGENNREDTRAGEVRWKIATRPDRPIYGRHYSRIDIKGKSSALERGVGSKISADSRARPDVAAIMRCSGVVRIHRRIYQPLCIAALTSVILITSVMRTAVVPPIRPPSLAVGSRAYLSARVNFGLVVAAERLNRRMHSLWEKGTSTSYFKAPGR